jgi:2-keto-3-deoxy-L-rhamnonate aldolase RhmA
VKNKILERIRKGEKALGLSLDSPSGELVELAGRMGLDFIAFDGQHAPITPAAIEQMCQLADGFGVTPTMRIPDGRESTILSYLDRGIKMITVPNLQTKEEAQALVKYTYFGPKGLRSATSLRTVFYQGSGDRAQLFAEINANTMLVPQLESATALANLDELLTVDGIEFFAGGFEDLAQSMEFPGGHALPQVQEAAAKADAKIRAAGKYVIADHMISVGVFSVVKEGIEELLQKHGRVSQLGW